MSNEDNKMNQTKMVLSTEAQQSYGGTTVVVEEIVKVLRGHGTLTSREIAKHLGVHKHDINKVVYKNPAVIVRVNDESENIPLWGVADGEDSEDEEEVNECEECGEKCDPVIHSFGCVALCEDCSVKNGIPHCPRTHANHATDPCDWCVAYWEAKDEDEDDCEECEWCHEEMELEENDDGDRLCEECMDEWQEQEDKRRRKEEKKARKIIQAQVPKETEEEEIAHLAKKVAEMELEVAKWNVPDYSAYGVEKEEEYVCYCMECDKPIKGMTEEEFNEDDELKLCAECEEEQDE